MTLSTLDISIIALYAVSIFVLAQWVSRERGTHKKDAQDYFLAGRSLPWWAIGTSLIAANISAEQIIGMSGSGYVIGLGSELFRPEYDLAEIGRRAAEFLAATREVPA